MRPAGILSDLVRLSIRKFVVDFRAYRATKRLQAGRSRLDGTVNRPICGHRQLSLLTRTWQLE